MPKSSSSARVAPRFLAVVTALVLLTGGALLPVSIANASTGTSTINRLAGTDRYETAVEISKAGFPVHAPVVYVATGLDFPDALAAAPAAAKQGGPLLLTTGNALPGVVRAELTRLAPLRIVVVGSSAVVSNRVFAQLEALAPKTVRLGGSDRFETARMIVDYAFESATTAYIATGTDFPDALSASGVAGGAAAPVVLVNGTKKTLAAPTAALLRKLNVSTTIVVGGPSVVSPGIEESLQAFGVSRLSGDDRFETSQKVNSAAVASADRAFFATGYAFPDALAGAAVAGAKSAPLYVTRATCIPGSVKNDVAGIDITLIGSSSVLGKGVAELRVCPGSETPGPVPEPVVTEPVVTEPVVTEPVVTEPVVTEPVVTEPVVTEPVVTEPVVTEPVVTEPVETVPAPPETTLPVPTVPTVPTVLTVPTVPQDAAPGPDTTGVPAGVKLAVHSGDIVVARAGTVINAVDVRGTIIVKAADVTISNSIIRGRVGSKAVALIDAGSNAASNLLVRDSELVPSNPSNNMNGIYGFDFTALRLNIHRVVDAVHIYGDNVRIESSWLHENFHGPDSRHADGYTHDDSIQIQKGTNIRVINNEISGAHNAAVMITQDQGPVSDFRFEGNFADGGACTINIAQKSFGPLQGLAVIDNTFGRNTRLGNCAVISPTTTHVDMQRNFFNTGELVAVKRG